MALTYSQYKPTHSVGVFRAPDFCLPGVDGRDWGLKDFNDARALLVVFMCNHCPYVIAVQERINRLAVEFQPRGLRTIGINSNDPSIKPADGFEAMKVRAREQSFAFPYVQDLSQDVARAYDAVCTPDLYLFERDSSGFLLRYHGRIDDSWQDESRVNRRELAEAIDAILSGRDVSADQKPAMCCSIKWRT